MRVEKVEIYAVNVNDRVTYTALFFRSRVQLDDLKLDYRITAENARSVLAALIIYRLCEGGE